MIVRNFSQTRQPPYPSARRTTELYSLSILLVEAGPPYYENTQIVA